MPPKGKRGTPTTRRGMSLMDHFIKQEQRRLAQAAMNNYQESVEILPTSGCRKQPDVVTLDDDPPAPNVSEVSSTSWPKRFMGKAHVASKPKLQRPIVKDKNLMRMNSHRSGSVIESLNRPSTSTLDVQEDSVARSNYSFFGPNTPWFPRSRVVFCCARNDLGLSFHQSCISIGFEESEISVIDTYQTLKNLDKKAQVGRVIICTQQVLTKLVTSDSALATQIRCMAVWIESNESLSKCNKIVGNLIEKEPMFRTILLTPSVPTMSRKTNLITKRQQMIVIFRVSQWEEPNVAGAELRKGFAPLGIVSKYWQYDDILSPTRLMLSKWKQGTSSILERLPSEIGIASINPDHLLFFDWVPLLKFCSASEDLKLNLDALDDAKFLCTCYTLLLMHGPRACYLFMRGTLLDNNPECRADKYYAAIVSDTNLVSVYEDLQKNYDYNQISEFDISYNEKSLRSCTKYGDIYEFVKKYTQSAAMYCGVVVCENKYAARAAAESLTSIQSSRTILVVGNESNIPVEFRSSVRTVRQTRTIFDEMRRNFVVVLSMDTFHCMDALDSLCSDGMNFVTFLSRSSICLLKHNPETVHAYLFDPFERLRYSDGRLFSSAEEEAASVKLAQENGMLNRYEFKFEYSALAVDVRKLRIVYIHKDVQSKDGDISAETKENGLTRVVQSSPRSAVFLTPSGLPSSSHRMKADTRTTLMTASELAEYEQLLGTRQAPPVPLQRSRMLLSLEENPLSLPSNSAMISSMGQLEWCTTIQLYGDVESSDLRRRVNNYMNADKSKPLWNRKLPARFQTTDDAIDKQRIEFYDDMLLKLDKLLTI